ncbi:MULTISPECIES: hypothetical protein [unclassified Azospirillum]|uniref:hypothetical protein n=1 Tax=unclassified Azospirillum TaxID=2630922 RepID=UPI000B7239DD|nr:MULTISPECIES: hypothetical protein [unclassified Azospirillum]SNR97824.1 hypothetical protein SAMN05880556_101907 [Azospirillum sp. RU38E]SNS14960.1 hypothetical protein SAMN05880591_101907 [Azospirillum sp. RU37A]
MSLCLTESWALPALRPVTGRGGMLAVWSAVRAPFWLVALALLSLLLLLAPAARAQADQNAVANRQFVLAMQAIQRADQTYNADEQTKLLLEADRLLTDIITRLPESALAVQLVTNQFIGDFDYAQFKTKLRSLVCSDPKSSRCLLHRIEGLIPPVEYPIATPRWDWLSFAVANYHIGDKERVRPIVAPFLQAMRNGSASSDISQDLFVGRTLALTGEIDLALQITRGFADCSTRIYNLSDIVESLVWQGNMGTATQVAEEAVEFARTQGCAWELGLVAQSLLRVGLEARARTLFLNTVEEQFSRFKDKRGNCCPPELAVAAGDLGDANLALGLLRTVQEESPWVIPQVLGKLEARGEKALTLTYADQLQDMDLKAETYVELIGGALRAKDRSQADLLSARLDKVVNDMRSPVVLVQRARADKLMYSDQRWRGSFQTALSEAERGAGQRRDLAVPFLAALVQIETGRPMLE